MSSWFKEFVFRHMKDVSESWWYWSDRTTTTWSYILDQSERSIEDGEKTALVVLLLYSTIFTWIAIRTCWTGWNRKSKWTKQMIQMSSFINDSTKKKKRSCEEDDFLFMFKTFAAVPVDVLAAADLFDGRKMRLSEVDCEERTIRKDRNGEFVAYCPTAFEHLRAIHGILLADIAAKFQHQSFAKGEGKSGSHFVLSQDKRFCMKTISATEKNVLLKMMPAYYAYIVRHLKSTYLCRILGLFKAFSRSDNKEVWFILMPNVAEPIDGRRISATYDLKGSLHGRRVRSGEKRSTLKDINFIEGNCCVHLPVMRSQIVVKQLAKDATFLRQCGIMDYSLLLVLYEDKSRSMCQLFPGIVSRLCASCLRCHQRTRYRRFGHEIGVGTTEYAMGIIDILQSYNTAKFVENSIKGTVGGLGSNTRRLFDGKQTAYVKNWVPSSRVSLSTRLHSALEPKAYSKRFIDFHRDHVFHRPMCHAYQRRCSVDHSHAREPKKLPDSSVAVHAEKRE